MNESFVYTDEHFNIALKNKIVLSLLFGNPIAFVPEN